MTDRQAIFSARYPGRCNAECGSRIEEGDTLTYVDDLVVHLDCARDTTLRQKPEVVCESCWIVTPCGCEDD